MKEFSSKCPRCDHVEWFYTEKGRDLYDEQRKRMLPKLSFVRHRHPLPDYADYMIHSIEVDREFRKMREEMA